MSFIYHTTLLCRAEHCQKYQLDRKTRQIKVVENKIPNRKFCGRKYLSPPGVELRGGSENCHVSNYYNVLKGESRFTFGLNAAKDTDCINFCLKHFLI